MNILFLDFDGVVNTPIPCEDENGAYHLKYAWPEDGAVNNSIALRFIEMFCIRFNYDIVVSSSWRREANYIDCLRKAGLSKRVKVLGCTSTTPGKYSRGDRIKEYLSNCNNVKNFIIVDDDNDVVEIDSHLIQTNGAVGFTLEDYYKMVALHMNMQVDGQCSVQKEESKHHSENNQ